MSDVRTPGNLAQLLETLQTVDGVVACGACLGNSLVVYRHRPDYPISRDQAKVIWKSVKETFHHLINHKLPADHLHWAFGKFNLHAVYRNAVAVGIMMDKTISHASYQMVGAALEAFTEAESTATR